MKILSLLNLGSVIATSKDQMPEDLDLDPWKTRQGICAMSPPPHTKEMLRELKA